MSVKATTEKNFRRARVSPSRRTRGWRWRPSWRVVRVAISAALVAYGGYRAVDLVVSASPLQVRRITVEGNVRLSPGEVQALVEGLRGSSIITADLDRYRRRLLQSPWIADVALRRVLPSTIQVFVDERRPMGICRVGGVLYLVDRQGTLIDEFGPQYADFDLPIIDGLVRAPGTGSPVIDPERAALAGRVIDAIAARPALAGKLSQIDVTDRRDAVVLLDDDPALLHLGQERFLERLQGYVEIAAAFRERVGEIDYVDLRFPPRYYVLPRAGTKRVAPPPDRPAASARQF